MSNPNFENHIKSTADMLKEFNPKMKESTLKTYKRMISRYYYMLGTKKAPSLKMTLNANVVPMCLMDTQERLKEIENYPWKDSTKKNYISLLCSISKAFAVLHLEQTDFEKNTTYADYRKAFDILKASNAGKQEKQEPKENEVALKELSMDMLNKSLSYHYNKIRKSDSKDIESALLYLLGSLHIDQVLRNECAGMLITKEWLPLEEHKDTNFIWLKGRNVKVMVIRNNKVRNPEMGHEPKEVFLKGQVNTAINKYIQILHNIYGEHLQDIIPLVHSNHFTNSASSGDGSENISSSHYSQVFKRIWKHKELELTTTSIRKVYAMDIRKEYGGNLLKEKEACVKLDHSQETHNSFYILNWD